MGLKDIVERKTFSSIVKQIKKTLSVKSKNIYSIPENRLIKVETKEMVIFLEPNGYKKWRLNIDMSNVSEDSLEKVFTVIKNLED